MANRNNPQNTNQQNRTRGQNRDQNRSQNRNRDYNRDYGRDYGNDQWQYTTYYYETPYDEDFYDYDYDSGAYPDTYSYTEYWLVPGPYVGFGPSDWQRSDESIREDVNERLTLHGQLDARDIHVKVDNGVVTLSGTVPSRREKRLAEDVADSVSGVQDVQNELHLQNKNQQNQRQLGQGQRQQGQGQTGASFQGGQVHQGMDVFSLDGKKIGTVKDIRNNNILVDRSLKEDIFIPFSAISVQNDRVILNVSADQVNDQGWQTPETKTVKSATQS